MSVSTSVATIVGVSFVEVMEANGFDTAHAEDVASSLGLDTWLQMPKFDTPTDFYVGTVFHERPTDAEVAEATVVVEGALQALEQMIGAASSGVEVWQGVCIS